MLRLDMEELLDSLWALSGPMQTAALIAMLAGLLILAIAAARCFKSQQAGTGDVRLAKFWRTGWGAVGLGMLLIGGALDAFAIWVRLGPPGRF